MLNLPKNIYVISLVISLSFTTSSMMILVAGLLGAAIAPNPELATLPIAMMIVGSALATIPAAMIMQRIGRKAGMATGAIIALIGIGLAYHAAMTANFWLFTVGAVCLGLNVAFIQQGRFIIIENAGNQQQQADGISLALMANLFAAIIGPQMGAYGKDLVTSPAGFAGSFLLAGVLILLSLIVLSLFKNQENTVEQTQTTDRAITAIAKQPIFIMAAGSAAIGFGIMSLIMTATPISMHEITGLSLEQTTFVIQSHIVAMFLPSLFSGMLIKKGYRISLLITGLSLYVFVALIALSGVHVLHYWWALVLLGLGWNLLFVTSTNLLPNAYNGGEKFKAQALNDFLVFSTQAMAAFAAGWLLFNLGWASLLQIALIVSILWAGYIIFLQQKIKAQ